MLVCAAAPETRHSFGGFVRIDVESPGTAATVRGTADWSGVDMRNRNVGAHRLSSPILPDLESEAREWIQPSVQAEIVSSPAFREITRALACAHYLNLDLSDPDVIRQAIASGEWHHMNDGTPAYRPRPRKGLHEPVVYYVLVGSQVKIGTSRNIVTRCAILLHPVILAIERGDANDEARRHEFFAPLRVHGEWFRHEDPLKSYIEVVAEAFEADFGLPLNAWFQQLRSESRF